MKKTILLSMILLLLALPLSAQEDDPGEPPLLAMLGHVPNAAEIRDSIIGWADLRLADEARGLPPFDERAAYELAKRLDRDGIWLYSLPGYGMPPNWSQYLMIALEEGGAELTGFELFDLDYTLYAGNPPAGVVVLQGRFDESAIDSALTARDYTVANNADDVTLWCGPEGCDSGQETDFQNMNPANLFGGHLGRSEPLALAGDTVLNSPDLATLQGLIAAYRDEIPSLADDPIYRAAATYAVTAGDLRQVNFVSAATVFAADPVRAILGDRATEEQMEELRERLGLNDDYVPVGQVAELLAITDHVDIDADTATASLVLVYGDAETAQTAHDELTRRLEESELLLMSLRQPLRELLDERGYVLVGPELVTDEENGKTLLVLSIESELVRGEGEEDGRLQLSAMAMRLWVDMVYNRDLIWLN